MINKTEMQRKIVSALWSNGMKGTITDDHIRITADDGSEFQITIQQIR